MEQEYITQIEMIQRKVIEIEKSIEQAAETVNDLVTSICSFMGTDSSVNNVTNEKITDIENDLECIEHKINHIKTWSFDDGEKIAKMNRQMHVLSSKFVDFDIKINCHLLDFNRNNLNKIEPEKIIDSAAKQFMVTNNDLN